MFEPPEPMEPRDFRRAVGVACIVGLVLRVAAVVWIPTQPVSDFWVYFQGALELAHSHTYSFSVFPPAYPIVVALGLVLLPGVPSLIAAKIVNLLLAGIAIVLAGLVGREVGAGRVGALASFGFALYPRLVLQPCLIASENLFSPLLLLFAYIVLRGIGKERGGPSAALVVGLIVGALALTRPVGYLLGFLWLVGAIGRRRALPTVLAGLAVLLGAQHLVMLPWALHNEARFGRFAFLPPTDGWNLLQGYQPAMSKGNRPWNEVLGRPDPNADFGKDQFDLNDRARRVVYRWMAEHPGSAARQYIANLQRFFWGEGAIARWVIDARGITPPSPPIESLPGEHPLKRHLWFLRGAMQGAWIVLLAFAGAGVICLWKEDRQGLGLAQSRVALYFLCGVASYFLVVTCVYHVSDRYRWPMEDVLFPLAASSVAAAPRLLARGRRGGHRTLGASVTKAPYPSVCSRGATTSVVRCWPLRPSRPLVVMARLAPGWWFWPWQPGRGANTGPVGLGQAIGRDDSRQRVHAAGRFHSVGAPLGDGLSIRCVK